MILRPSYFRNWGLSGHCADRREVCGCNLATSRFSAAARARQLGNIGGDAARLVAGQQLGGRPSPRLILEIDIGQRVAVVILDDERATTAVMRRKSEQASFASSIVQGGCKRRAGSVILLQAFGDPNIAHSAIAKGLQSFLVSRTAIGSRRLFQARIFGNYGTLRQPVFVNNCGVPACENTSAKGRGCGNCELRIGRKFLPIGNRAIGDHPIGFRHNAISSISWTRPLADYAGALLASAGHVFGVLAHAQGLDHCQLVVTDTIKDVSRILSGHTDVDLHRDETNVQMIATIAPRMTGPSLPCERLRCDGGHHSAARTMVEGLIWLFSLAFGRTPPVGSFECVTIGVSRGRWWRLRS
jgi:hypothetical protein